jgi:hypothetical protein
LAALWSPALVANAQESALQVSGGLTMVGLHPNEARIQDDQTLSADLFVERSSDRGRWLLYIEGNSSLDVQAASTILIEANADAGTALDPDRNGRIQISELNYQFWRRGGDRLTVGLVDSSAYLDRTRITNDENLQFLGASFVNNPTIEFPDYTIGLVYEKARLAGRPQINAVLTSSNGLADNPNLSYSQLLEFTDGDKGVFAAIGLGWPEQTHLTRVGAWVNTRSHTALAGNGATNKDNYGVYAVHGRSWGSHAVNLRIGLANPEISQGSGFSALAYRYRWRAHAIGVGMARTFVSTEETDPDLDDSTQLEIFGRFTLNESFHLTVSIQKLIHSGFVARTEDPRHSVLASGLRIHYAF